MVEPYLLRLGLMVRTPRGRLPTESAYRHLGRAAPGAPGSTGSQGSLFRAWRLS